MINKLKENLSKYMIIYTVLVITAGLTFGSIWNLKFLSSIILPVVFIMIYPMMVNLSLSSLKKIKGSKKPLIIGMILNFIWAPLFMYLLTWVFHIDPDIKLALMLMSIAPASSMGLGYIGLAEGHMLSGAIIVASAFILSIFVYPIAGHYLALGANIPVPFIIIIKNLLLILILPLILGIITREYVEKRHGSEKYLKIKPYFSTTTLIFLYILMFIIFASKANLILQNSIDILILLPIAILFYGVTVILTLILNKNILKLEYGQHQSIVFTSVSKNIALSIAVLISVFGEYGQYLAVFPAIMSLYQAPFLMIYLKFSKKIRAWFKKPL